MNTVGARRKPSNSHISSTETVQLSYPHRLFSRPCNVRRAAACNCNLPRTRSLSCDSASDPSDRGRNEKLVRRLSWPSLSHAGEAKGAKKGEPFASSRSGRFGEHLVSRGSLRRAATMDSARPRRVPIKSRRPDWREELRKNCLRRVKKDRVHLLWKIRTHGQLPANDMNKVESAVRNIISDELQKFKQCVDGEDQEIGVIWEYQGPQAAKPAEFESEDILLEMERLLYEDLREELIRKELEALDDEDAYLAQAVFYHMQLNDKEGAENAKLWCPVCKQGELRETHNLIYCTFCKLRLDLGEDKINLDFLRERLANVHMEHLDRGCKSSPNFCLQNMFGLTALYIQCEECNTFDIVV